MIERDADHRFAERGLKWYRIRLYARVAALVAVLGALLFAIPFPHAEVPCTTWPVYNEFHFMIDFGYRQCGEYFAATVPPSIIYIILGAAVMALWLKRKFYRAHDVD